VSTTPLTIGTAGHIDHGKTALVRALTGIDTDRLPEEHRRGISIELGYALLVLPSGRRVSVVDVPGHERFIRTMVAGASGIDLALIVVACDDGVMPQTREHVAICTLLGIERAVVALTKRDLVEDIEAGLARAEVEELLAGGPLAAAEIVETAISDADSIERVRSAIERASEGLSPVHADGATRLPIDRSFTLRGIGSVVTGTLWSGTVGIGDHLVLAPDGPAARVRSVEVHDQAIERAGPGQRVAASLVGVEHGQARRGQMLVAPGTFPASFRLDVRLEAVPGGPGLANGALVRVLHGTADIEARVALLGVPELRPGEPALAQLRLHERAVAARGDRLVVRLTAPAITVAGGVVLDPAPRRHGAGEPVLDRLESLEEGDVVSIVRSTLGAAAAAVALDRLAPPGLLDREHARAALVQLERAGEALPIGSDAWIDAAVYDALRERVSSTLEARAGAEPLRPTVPLAALLPSEAGRESLADRLAADGVLVREGSEARAPGARARATEVHERAAAAVLEALEASGATPPDPATLESVSGLSPGEFRALVAALARDGDVVRLGADVVYAQQQFAAAQAWVESHCRETGSVTLAQLRDGLGTNRRMAQAILERLDVDGVTRRIGDARVLRRQRSSPA
jgi:selenocysteine-specific elongation factor